MNTKKTSQILPALFAVICAALAGYFILIGSGMFTEPSVDLILLATTTILLLSSLLFYFATACITTCFLYAYRAKFWSSKLPIYRLAFRDRYVRNEGISIANPCE